MGTKPPLYGPQQSRFAHYLERREQRRPDQEARALRRRLLAGLHGNVLEVGSGDGRSFEHYQPGVDRLLAVEPKAILYDDLVVLDGETAVRIVHQPISKAAGEIRVANDGALRRNLGNRTAT